MKSESLSASLREEAEHIWSRIMEHPFVVGLYEGSLDLDRFKFYVIQDYNFLVESMRAFSLLASKADPETARLALEVAYGDATIEMDNYKRLLPELGLTLEEVLSTEPAPTNIAYTSFLVATCATRDPLECLVALLPCYWSYLEIAERHKDKLASNPSTLYRQWASAYLSSEYRSLVENLRGRVDALWGERGGDYGELRRIFLIASRYEYLFWDMAYKREEWPV
jgi:thiaminase/transcriptional activator TenA